MSNPNHDEELYAQAAAELEDGNRDEGLWAKCFVKCDGDENKAKARYIKTRTERLPKNPMAELLKLIVKWFKLLLYAIAWLSGLFLLLAFLFVSLKVSHDITNEILIFIFGETIADKLPHALYAPDRRIPDVSGWIGFPLHIFIAVAMFLPVQILFWIYVAPQIDRLDDWLKKRLNQNFIICN